MISRSSSSIRRSARATKAIRKGEVLVEIETAKAIQEVEAPVGGTLTQILLPEGETAAVNTPIAVIEEDRA